MENFPVKAILLIRHPCATISSQLQHAWKDTTKENYTLPSNLIEQYPHIGEVFERIEHQEELLALDWAMKTFVPLQEPKPHPWLLLTYEKLVEKGTEQIQRIFSYLGEEIPEEAIQRLTQASRTTASQSNVAKGKNPLSGWKEKLETIQIDRILK